MDWHGEELPSSVQGDQRLTGMTASKAKPLVASKFRFAQHGTSGAWMSELLPHLASVADDLCILRAVHTEAINHDPAVTYMQTGHQQPGRPSMGAWLSYGLGSESQELPAFVVLVSRGSAVQAGRSALCAAVGGGVLAVAAPGDAIPLGRRAGVVFVESRGTEHTIAAPHAWIRLAALNRQHHEVSGDPEIEARIAQYEKAFRMQTAVPELVDLRSESANVLEEYGPDAGRPGTFATHCLLARRMVERGVRFVQLYHRGWDQHYNLPSDLRLQCQRCRSAVRGADSRSQAARAAR